LAKTQLFENRETGGDGLRAVAQDMTVALVLQEEPTRVVAIIERIVPAISTSTKVLAR